jgi:hypothetical protein
MIKQPPRDETIILTEEESAFATDCGTKLYNFKREGHRVDRSFSDDKGPYLDIIGKHGEIAVHKYFNKPFVFTIHKDKDKYDIILKDTKIDVKTSTKDIMRVPEYQKDSITEIEAYLFVQTDRDFNFFWLRGVINRAKFFKHAVYREDDSGKFYVLEDESFLTNVAILQ